MNSEETLSDILNYDLNILIKNSNYAFDEVSNAIEYIYDSKDRTDIRAMLFDAVKDLDTIETVAKDAKKDIREIAYKL